jgi:hypothetical protein
MSCRTPGHMDKSPPAKIRSCPAQKASQFWGKWGDSEKINISDEIEKIWLMVTLATSRVQTLRMSVCRVKRFTMQTERSVGLSSVKKIARVIGHAQDIRYMPPPNTKQYANTYIEIYSNHYIIH